MFMNTISTNQNDVIVYPIGGTSNYSEDGIDLTLIRWALSLTPEERVKVLQNNIISIYRLKKCKTQNQKS